MSVIKFAASAAIAVGALTMSGIGTQPAHAASDATPVLKTMCELKGGSFYVTPYARARCQESKPWAGERGLWIERVVCERLMDGTFNVAPSYGAPKGHFTWVCI